MPGFIIRIFALGQDEKQCSGIIQFRSCGDVGFAQVKKYCGHFGLPGLPDFPGHGGRADSGGVEDVGLDFAFVAMGGEFFAV